MFHCSGKKPSSPGVIAWLGTSGCHWTTTSRAAPLNALLAPTWLRKSGLSEVATPIPAAPWLQTMVPPAAVTADDCLAPHLPAVRTY
jgi:hypothetical protein